MPTSTGEAPALPGAWRVEVFRDPAFDDPAGESARSSARELGLAGLSRLRLGRGFLLPPDLERSAVEGIVAGLLADPVVDAPRITPPGEAPATSGDHRVLVARRPGVMDPVAQTVERLLERQGELPPGPRGRVTTFAAWEVEGSLSPEELQTLGSRVLANEVIEELLTGGENLAYQILGDDAPRGAVHVPLAGLDRDALVALSKEGCLSLTAEEMEAVQAYFAREGREPTACELETVAQTWSEHCKHKTLTGIIEMDGERIDNLLRSTIGRATRELDKPWCVSVFKDNAGIVEFDRGMDVCFKVETHNHPSAIDPYGGAGTGIGGVIRDILGAGLGARPIANTDSFFVGPLDLPREELPKGTMHPRRILRGIVAGVRDYGNCMGIPTVSGGLWFHRDYTANPLVYAGTVGILPHEAAEKEVHPGDHIVAVGGRTGRDGIHGATFSSIELSEDSEMTAAAAVQIGDPITEKTVLDCQIAARDQGLYRAVTDCGAGGFSSAVGEMGEPCGARVDLSQVPLKYPGLAGHEIWISEAQERMVFAVPPEKLEAFLAVFAAEDVEAVAIGTFTDTGRLEVYDGDERLADLDMHFLHEGTPRPVRQASWSPPTGANPGAPTPPDGFGSALLALLGAPNIASREWLVRQYDHEVQGQSVVKPLVGPRADGPGDAAVLQPLADSRRGLALSCGANPEQGRLDPWAMAACAIDEAVRNAVAVGADPSRAAILDNFSWGNCDKPDRLGSLVLAAKACYEVATAYGTPFISGKDSLNNEYRVGERSIPIPPTLLISSLAIVPDVARTQTMDLKRPGRAVYLVGATRAELGGSHYHVLLGLSGGRVPRPELRRAPRIFATLHGEIAAGRVAACHDLSEGGLAVAAAEMAFAGRVGLELDLARVPVEDTVDPGDDPDALRLFSESATRFLVEIADEHAALFEAAFQDLPCARVGTTLAEDRLRVLGTGGDPIVDESLERLAQAHGGDFHG